MTSADLFTILASPAARKAFTKSIRAAANNNERPTERPCQHCGQFFDSGVFIIVDGRVVDIACTACETALMR